MRQTKPLLILLLLTYGCSRQSGLTLSGTPGSGDLVQAFMLCVSNRDGHVTTNTLPVIQATWTHQSRDAEDIFLVSGDHFTEMQKVFEQAYGRPDTSLGSSAVAPMGYARALTYSPKQCGVVLNLTGTSDQTVVLVIGKQKL